MYSPAARARLLDRSKPIVKRPVKQVGDARLVKIRNVGKTYVVMKSVWESRLT